MKKKLTIVGSLAASTVLAVAGAEVIPVAIDYNETMARASVSTPEFKAENEQMLRNLNLAMSFNPDEFESMDEALDAARYFHDVLGIKGVRVGIEWDKVEKIVDGKKTYDFSYYQKLINEWMKFGDTRITFNLGIKTFGWPEQRVPEQYRQMLEEISRNGGVVEANHPLAIAALEYEDAFFRYLLENYTQEQLSKVDWQLENEAYNPYGEDGTRVTMSDEYVMKSILNAARYFPDAKYKISSAGFFNVNQIENVIQKIHIINPDLNLDIAIGYYFDTPVGTPIGSVNTMNWIVWRPDPFAVDGMLGPFGNSLHSLPDFLKKNKNVTASESEGEITPWVGNDYSSFPTSVSSLKFLLLRSAEFLDTSKPFEISLWKLPDLYKARNDPRYKKNIKEIFDFIIMVNVELKKPGIQIDTTTNVLGNTIVSANPKTGEVILVRFPPNTPGKLPRRE